MSFPARWWAVVPVILVSSLLTGCASFWSSECDTVPGSRVKYHSGKVWPPSSARPSGPSEPLVHRYHTAHYWPDPLRWGDRCEVKTHLNSYADEGWVNTTTLYDQHFDPNTQEINLAGKTHLRWVLQYAPPNRRIPWVAAGENPQISETRLASVRREATAVCGNDLPPIMLRACQSLGTSAQEIDVIRRSYIANTPSPRLVLTPIGGSAGSGGSSSQSSGGSSGGGGSP